MREKKRTIAGYRKREIVIKLVKRGVRKLKPEELITLDKSFHDYNTKYNIVPKDFIWEYLYRGFDVFAMEKLEKNPYVLMGMGYSLKRIDSFVMQELKLSPSHPSRINAFLDLTLGEISKGSTVIGIAECVSGLCKKLEIQDSSTVLEILSISENRDKTYYLLGADKKIIKKGTGVTAWYITLQEWYEAEKQFYNWLLKASKQPMNDVSPLQESDLETLNSGQKKAVQSLVKSGVGVLTGWGGSGKTYTVRKILDYFDRTGQTYRCLAPTGIASKVFKSSTDRECTTIHMFAISGNAISTDWLILEETSMYSVEHLKILNRMMSDSNAKVLFIGDINQLTPISVGEVLHNVIKLIERGKIKGVVQELTEIMRSKNELFIPHLSKMFCKENSYAKPSGKLNGVEMTVLGDASAQIDSIISSNSLLLKDTLILSPQNIGEYGTNEINNKIVQGLNLRELCKDNFENPIYKDGIYINTKNKYNIPLLNGDRIIPKYYDEDTEDIHCEVIGEDRTIKISSFDWENFKLGYALSVHKVQGITAENVIMVASNKHYYMLTRNLVYTGLSRASKKLFVLYEERCLETANRKFEVNKRKTFLGFISEM